jgi:UDP-N-acetylglucosamine acyltransferase
MAEVTVIREIDPAARIAPDAVVGPYSVVGPNVTIGPGTRLGRRVSVAGHTRLGAHNVVEDGCVLGAAPQDVKYAGEAAMLMIGDRNHFGHRVTAHIGTAGGGRLTRIGDDNVLGDACHIAHDCYVDDATRLGRSVLLAGHIRAERGAIIDDLAGVHHFVTIGRYARVGARTPVRRDVPPYTLFAGGDGTAPAVRGTHEAGLADADLADAERRDLRRALADLFADESALQTKIEHLVNMGVEGEVAALCEFCQRSLRGVFGRHREVYRGQSPPEARRHLPADVVLRPPEATP